MSNQYYVYIQTNKHNQVLYVGVTNDLIRRVFEHKKKLVAGFTSKYNLSKLVYFEEFDDIREAILREKQIKGGPRKQKINLIRNVNPGWNDLFDEIASP